jgi:hypothetical protein
MKKFLLALALMLSLSVASFAQFEASAELRNRVEFRDGYKSPLLETQEPNFLMFQRTRILFGYKNEKLSIFVAPQDARVWGDDPIISGTGTGDNPSFALYKAYAEYQFDSLNCLSIGRQELKYDNQRLLAVRNWGNTGLTYDAVVFKTNLKGYNVHLGLTWNNTSEAFKDNFYQSARIKSQDYIWVNKKFGDLNISAIQLFTGKTKTDTANVIYFKGTSGLFFNYKIKDFIIEGDGYYQWGENNKSQKVDAYMASLDVKYKIKCLEAGLGAAYLSGDKTTTDDVDRTFDLGYGAMHKFLGGMDYFNTISKDTKNGGLLDGYAYLNFALTKNVKFKECFHYFQLAQTNTNYETDKLGIENDFVAEFKVGKNFVIEAGYLLFSPTKTMNAIKNTTDAKLQGFGYIQLCFNIDVFKSK